VVACLSVRAGSAIRISGRISAAAALVCTWGIAFAQPAPAPPGPAAAASSSASASVAPSASASASVAPSASASAVAEAPPPEPATDACAPCGNDDVEKGKLGLRYELEAIRVRGNKRTLARTILRYVEFRPGDEIDVEDPRLELTRYRLLGTGFFRDVQISLSKGPRKGVVYLYIDVIERNTIVINDVWLGVSADATPDGNSRPLTAYAGLDVAETNFYGTGISVGGAVALADRQSAYRFRIADPSFLGSSWIFSASLLLNDARDFFGTRDVLYDPPPGESEKTDYAVMHYRRYGGEIGLGYDLGTSTRLSGNYHFESIHADVPKAASHRRGLDIEPIDFHLLPGRSLLSYIGVQLAHDTRDDPVLPTRGHRLDLGSDFGLPTLGSDYSFLRLQGRAAQYWTLNSHGHVFKLDLFGGAVFGDAPLFMRFYVGDLSDFLPDRVLDLNFDRRPPPNFLRTVIDEMRYEEFAARVLGEYRIPIHRGTRSIYGIDLFASAGFYSLLSRRDVSATARGYHGFAKAPIDLTFNLGLRISTKAGGFVFTLANALGFLPIRSGGGP
jgi:outer membrane protein assembly factor BamA